MEIKKVTCKSLTFSDSEKSLLENTATLLYSLYGEDAFNQIVNQVIDEIGGGIYDFEDMSQALRELANGEYVIKEIE